MKINFNDIEEKALHEFKGGEGDFLTRMNIDDKNKVMLARLEPGSSIGEHLHDVDSEIMFIISGKADYLYDGKTEVVSAGECHYCPKGHSHKMVNNYDEDVVFYAVVAIQ